MSGSDKGNLPFLCDHLLLLCLEDEKIQSLRVVNLQRK